MDLLMEGDLGPMSEEQMEGLTVVRGKSQELATLVEDILRIQRMEQEVLDREMVMIPSLAGQVIRTMQADAEKTGIELVTDFPPDLPPVAVDVEQVRQVLHNLLDNALKFSPGTERVTVRARNLGPAIQVDVIDEGIGISVDEHEKIWRRFYQVDGSMTRQYGGTGLGLAIVKEIVEKHGGRVWVESEPGRGSTFTFLLPRMDAMG
jgi:signal transduction histidine kinase